MTSVVMHRPRVVAARSPWLLSALIFVALARPAPGAGPVREREPVAERVREREPVAERAREREPETDLVREREPPAEGRDGSAERDELCSSLTKRILDKKQFSKRVHHLVQEYSKRLEEQLDKLDSVEHGAETVEQLRRLLARRLHEQKLLSRLGERVMAGDVDAARQFVAQIESPDLKWLLSLYRFGPAFLLEQWTGESRRVEGDKASGLVKYLVKSLSWEESGPTERPAGRLEEEGRPPKRPLPDKKRGTPLPWPPSPAARPSAVVTLSSPTESQVEPPGPPSRTESPRGSGPWVFGIILACAAAAGFTLLRRRGQSVPGPTPSSRDPTDHAMRLFRKGNTDGALTELQRLLPRDGGAVTQRLRWALSMVFVARRDLSSAAIHVQALDPDSLSLVDLYQLARALEDAGSVANASLLYSNIRARDVVFRDVEARLVALTDPQRDVPEDIVRAVADRYQDLRLLGRGGMGTVYRAVDRKLKRPVAIKVPESGLVSSPEAQRRFLREAQSIAGLSHPNIVRIYDVSTTKPFHYTMELVEGRSLRAILEGRPGLPVAEALDLLRPIAAALSACHARSIIHRDIKPENILVDGAGVSRLADFGLAYQEGATRLTRQNMLVGTPSYLSPEQLEGAPPAPSVDIWAFGVTLYETLTGVNPFRAAPGAVALHTEGLNPRRFKPETPAELDALVAACTARDPAARPADGTALVERLDRLVSAPVNRESVIRDLTGRLEDLVAGDLHSLKNRLTLVGCSTDEVREALARTREELGRITFPDWLGPGPVQKLAELRLLLADCTTDAVQRAHFQGLALLESFSVPLRRTLEAVATGYAGRCTTRVILDLPPPPIRTADVEGARSDLSTILSNLIDNSVAAGARSVELTLGTAEPDEAAARILVVDDGPGFGVEERARALVAPFGTRQAGHGTGLTTVARLARSRGWRVTLLNAGRTTFEIVLPAGRVGTGA